MSADSLLSILLSIPIGVISGLYTGLIVTRYARFAELRNEALRIIRTIDFVHEAPKILVFNDQDISRLVVIASDLFFLSHRNAGEKVIKLSNDIQGTNKEARDGRVSIREYEDHYSRWQAVARDLPPSKRVIWRLWGKL